MPAMDMLLDKNGPARMKWDITNALSMFRRNSLNTQEKLSAATGGTPITNPAWEAWSRSDPSASAWWVQNGG